MLSSTNFDSDLLEVANALDPADAPRYNLVSDSDCCVKSPSPAERSNKGTIAHVHALLDQVRPRDNSAHTNAINPLAKDYAEVTEAKDWRLGSVLSITLRLRSGPPPPPSKRSPFLVPSSSKDHLLLFAEAAACRDVSALLGKKPRQPPFGTLLTSANLCPGVRFSPPPYPAFPLPHPVCCPSA